MSIRDEALAAHYEAQERRDSTMEQVRLDERRQRADEEQRVLGLVRESPLAEWFPTAEWEVYATTSDKTWHGMRGYRAGGRFTVTPLMGVVCADRPTGTDPEWAGVPCFGLGPLEPNASEVPDGGAPDRARVFFVHTRYDEGYTSWEGAEVRSLEELGERIAKHEVATRTRLQEEAQTACRCFKAGQSPVTTKGLRCAHSAEHAARLRAADASNSRAQFAEHMRVWRAGREA